jgi:hypothetical protein
MRQSAKSAEKNRSVMHTVAAIASDQFVLRIPRGPAQTRNYINVRIVAATTSINK